MPQFQTVTIQGKGLFSKNMTLTLTDKWLIVKDSFGGEVMRLSSSQANMRVEAWGSGILLVSFICFLLGLFMVSSTLFMTMESGALSPLSLLGAILIVAGFWRLAKSKYRKLYLVVGCGQFFLVKPEEVPKLYQLMEMVENWTANKER